MIIDEKYKKLADWIKDRKESEGFDEWNIYNVLTNNFGERIDELVGYSTSNDELNIIMPMIHAICVGNYEIEEKKCNWRFLPLLGDYGTTLYLSWLNSGGHRLTNTRTSFGQLTQSEFDNLIEHNDYLSAEMFEPESVEKNESISSK